MRNIDDYLIAALVAIFIVILFILAAYLSGFLELLQRLYS
jgi:hypothetical protein